MPQRTINTPREETHQRIADALEDIVDKIVDTSRASNIDYDNTESGLSADKAQGAIDELAEEKVDKVTGKGLSTNDYTNAEKQKLANIESDAQVNVQSDWNEDDTEDDGYIKNKPDLSTSLTTTGNPITIESSESNLVECVAEVEAVQEGSGDPSPTNIRPIIGQTEVVIEDCGKNLFDEIYPNLSSTIQYKPIYVGDKTVTLSSTAPQGGGGGCVLFLLSGNVSTGADNITNGVYDGHNVTALANNGFVTIAYRIFYDINPQDYEADLSERKTYRVEIGQKNKLPMTVEGIKSANTNGTWSGNSYTHNNTTFTILTDSDDNVIGINVNTGSGGASNTAVLYVYYNNNGLSNFIGLKLNGVVSGSGGSSTYGLALEARGIKQYNGNDYIIANDDDTSKGIYIRVNSGTSVSNDMVYPMIRTTIDDSEFVPYNPNLPDTIYGGELDVIAGELRVTHGEVDLGDLSWSYVSSESRFYAQVNGIKVFRYNESANIISSCYRTAPWASSTNGDIFSADGYVSVKDSRYTNATAFKTAVTGQTLVYELATPYTIQLNPQQIRLLKGTNHLSCNTGDLSIKYYPDNVLGQLKGDIEGEYDERITELEEKANTPTIKQVEINRNAVSTDGSVMFTSLTGHIIVGTSISNDANGDKCVGIPYSMGNVPSLKIMNESTMAVLPNITISGTLYCIKL